MARYQGSSNPLKKPKILMITVSLFFFTLYIINLDFQSKYPQKYPSKTTKKTTTTMTMMITGLNPPSDTPYLSTEPPSYGYKNYSELIPGHLPLILSIPHGGHSFPYEIPDRKDLIPGMIKSNDINTQEVGHLLSQRIMKKLNGRKPYMVINHLGRSKIDVNRPLKEGVETKTSNETRLAWNDYHTFMKNSVDEIELRFGCGLLIDIHGM